MLQGATDMEPLVDPRCKHGKIFVKITALTLNANTFGCRQPKRFCRLTRNDLLWKR